MNGYGRASKDCGPGRDLIALSGLEPDEDISIEFIGLRPGEKLHEEPLNAQGTVRATIHKCIFMAEIPKVDGEQLKRDLGILKELAREGDGYRIAEKLKEMIPEYRPEAKNTVRLHSPGDNH